MKTVNVTGGGELKTKKLFSVQLHLHRRRFSTEERIVSTSCACHKQIPPQVLTATRGSLKSTKQSKHTSKCAGVRDRSNRFHFYARRAVITRNVTRRAFDIHRRGSFLPRNVTRASRYDRRSLRPSNLTRPCLLIASRARQVLREKY